MGKTIKKKTPVKSTEATKPPSSPKPNISKKQPTSNTKDKKRKKESALPLAKRAKLAKVAPSPYADVQVTLTFKEDEDNQGRKWPKHSIMPSKNPLILGELPRISQRIIEHKPEKTKPGQLHGLVVAGPPEVIGTRSFYPSVVDGKVPTY